MKKTIINILFVLVDIVCFLQGSIITAYALLNISYKIEVAKGDGLTNIAMQNVPISIGGYYYYTDQYITVAIIGIGLIVSGFLIRSWRKTFSEHL